MRSSAEHAHGMTTSTRHSGAGWRRGLRVGLSAALVAVGLAVACAPLLMDLSYRLAAHEEISSADDAWSHSGDRALEKVWRQARAYNLSLAGKRTGRVAPYARQLSGGGNSCMSCVRIESVGIELPVFHGTSEKALSAGAGHIEGTALPVGGKGCNCCLSAHSGVAQGSMFDRLRDVRSGDLVELRTLGRSLGYRVRDVAIVDPDDTRLLRAAEGLDLLTLITCTSSPQPGMPRGGYGVNDKRLVVVCERCELPASSPAEREAPSIPLGRRWWLAGIAAAAVAVLLVALARRSGAKKRNRARLFVSRESEESA